MSLSPAERVLRSRAGAYKQHSLGRTNTGPARAAYDARWAKLVDPDGVLDEAERERRAFYAKKAHYTDMAYRSARARSGKRVAQKPPVDPYDDVDHRLAELEAALRALDEKDAPAETVGAR